MEEYQLPQITIGARKKRKLYLGDLSNVMIWVRYNTHTLTHNTDTHTQCKQGQKSQEYQSKKQRKARRIISIFQEELT